MKARFEVEWDNTYLDAQKIENILKYTNDPVVKLNSNVKIKVTRLDPDWVELNKLKEANQKEILDMFNKYCGEILKPKEEFCECKTPKPLNLYWVKGEPKVCKCMKEIKSQPIEPETVFCDCGYPFKQCWCCKKPIESQQEKIEELFKGANIFNPCDPRSVVDKINEIISHINKE